MTARRHRVLLVDDDPRVMTALTDLLTAGGYDVVTADAPQPAPDVAVVDVHLPERSVGVDSISALTARGCPVIALSINSSGRAAALEAGAVAYVEKDSDPGQLLSALALSLRVSPSSRHPQSAPSRSLT
ncbi:MAG: response regulator [Actinomycetales bacterium]